MKLAVFGAGYVGLVTATCFAEVGNDVICVDVDASKIEKLNQGEVPIFEPGLEPMLKRNVEAGRIRFTTDPKIGLEHGVILFIAVGTPSDHDGSADLRYVLSVAETIGKHIKDYRLIVTKSTVPVGTSEKVRQEVQKQLTSRGATIEFDVASNPEFLKEGAAIEDFMKPDRIVVGVDNERASEHLKALYAPFNRNHNKLIEMDILSSELTKYTANAMLATKISFMNEISRLAEKVGADIEKIRIGIGADPRIGYHFIYAGCGYGGSCFPKDVRALQRTAEAFHYETPILAAVDNVNEQQKRHLVEKIKSYYQNDLKGKTFALLGLAFKPNTDDMREAPSLVVIDELTALGVKIQAYDPVAMPATKKLYPNKAELLFCDSQYETLKNADALIIVTEWSQFKSPDFELIKTQLRDKVIFDGRNLYDPAYLKRLGITYIGMGRDNQ